jgi:hypothetical protein
MMHRARIMAGILLALLPLLPVMSLAQSSRVFARIGEIQSIDLQKRVLEIDDTLFALDSRVRIYLYDLSTKDPQVLRAAHLRKQLEDLREGMLIGYNTVKEEVGRRGFLTELWILPTD